MKASLSNQSINDISVTIGNKTEALISKSWSIVDGQIACKFNLTNFKYNAQNNYQILEYTINYEILCTISDRLPRVFIGETNE